VKEFAMERFISLGRGFELMGATDLSDIVNEVLKALENAEKSRHRVLDERRLCVLGCIIDVSKRVNGAARFTDVMDCLKTSCGLNHRDYFYRYEEELEDEKLVAPVRVSRGKNLYMPTIRGVVTYNAALTLRLMGANTQAFNPQAFLEYAVVALGFLKLLYRTMEDEPNELFARDEHLTKFFIEAIDHTLNALTREEDVNQTFTFLTRCITTVNGKELSGFDMVEYLTNVVVYLHLVCTRGVIKFLNLDNFLKINEIIKTLIYIKALNDLRNNEPGGSQG
jgi:hypothetical protein